MTTPTDDILLRRAVSNARSNRWRKGTPHPRWTAVMDTFSLGSTSAQELVRRFGYDPDELVKR